MLRQPDDIFYLTLDEMGEVAASPRSMIEKARASREEFEANRTRPWPDIIRGGQEIYAQPATPAEAVDGQLSGVAGSPGLVTGVGAGDPRAGGVLQPAKE